MIKNTKMCFACGQDRTYPQEAGRWKYRDPIIQHWTYVTVREVEEGFEMTIDGHEQPAWWPEHAMWEKVEPKPKESTTQLETPSWWEIGMYFLGCATFGILLGTVIAYVILIPLLTMFGATS